MSGLGESEPRGVNAARNALLDKLRYDSTNGAILLGTSRYFLIRPETLGEVHDQMERRYPGSSAEILFRAGHTGVSAYLRTLPGDVSSNGKALVARVIETGSSLGWGNIRLLSLDIQGKRMELEVTGSAFVRPEQGVPTCHIFRGVFAALGERVFGGFAVSEELHCVALGSEKCAFVVCG